MPIAATDAATESLLTFPCAFPIKVMGRTQDGFAQAIVDGRAAARAGLRPGDARDARVERGQLPVGDGDDQRDLARRSSTISIASCTSHPMVDDGAVMAALAAATPRARASRSARSAAPTTRRRGARCRRSRRRATRRTPRRDLADRASADLHAGARRAARASAARQRHPGAQGRPRRPDHLSRARAARRLPAVRPASARGSASARWSGRIEARGGRMARFAGDCRLWQAGGAGRLRDASRAREAKIAALGLKVRNGCTYHGLARQRRDGPRAVRRHRSVRLPGARGHAARRSRRCAHRRTRPARSSRRSSPRISRR